MAREMLKSLDELVDFLGGDTLAGKWAGLRQSAIGNWKLRGVVPPAWHLRVLCEVRRRGGDIDPELFGLSEDEFAPLAVRAPMGKPVENHAA